MTFTQQSDKRFDENWAYSGFDYPEPEDEMYEYFKQFLHQELRAFGEEIKKEMKYNQIWYGHNPRNEEKEHQKEGYSIAIKDLQSKLDELISARG